MLEVDAEAAEAGVERINRLPTTFLEMSPQQMRSPPHPPRQLRRLKRNLHLQLLRPSDRMARPETCSMPGILSLARSAGAQPAEAQVRSQAAPWRLPA